MFTAVALFFSTDSSNLWLTEIFLSVYFFLPCVFKTPKPSAITMDDDLGTAGVRQVTVEVCNIF